MSYTSSSNRHVSDEQFIITNVNSDFDNCQTNERRNTKFKTYLRLQKINSLNERIDLFRDMIE